MLLGNVSSQLSGQKLFMRTWDFLDSGTQDGFFEQRDQEPSPSQGAGDRTEHTLSKKHWVLRILYPVKKYMLSKDNRYIKSDSLYKNNDCEIQTYCLYNAYIYFLLV